MNELTPMENKDTSILSKEIEHSICHDLIQHNQEGKGVMRMRDGSSHTNNTIDDG